MPVTGLRIQRSCPLLGALALAALPLVRAAAQQPANAMGTVTTRDARVTGGLEVQGDVTRLLTNASVTANDHPAPVTLQRGGGVMVCSTSEFHLVRSGTNGGLIFGLDRGAIEVVSQSSPQDALLTPDLKIVPVTTGLMDLRLRVTREGDTCVDNSGAGAPVLNVTDPFSSANYRVLPGQHLMFVKGDLHKVVDHERSSCGCPPAAAPRLATVEPGRSLTPAQAADAHPFPQAESVGLAPTTPTANEAPAGTAAPQVTTTFSYGEGQGPPPMLAAEPVAGATGAMGLTGSTGTPAPDVATTSEPKQDDIFHAIRRFFHRLFRRAKTE